MRKSEILILKNTARMCSWLISLGIYILNETHPTEYQTASAGSPTLKQKQLEQKFRSQNILALLNNLFEYGTGTEIEKRSNVLTFFSFYLACSRKHFNQNSFFTPPEIFKFDSSHLILIQQGAQAFLGQADQQSNFVVIIAWPKNQDLRFV